MNDAQQDRNVTVHWAGLDVSKDTFDAGLVVNGSLGHIPPLGTLPTQRFARTPEGVQAFVAWLDEHYQEFEGPVRCIMETTGRYSTELAVWLVKERPSLAPAIAHARHTANFIKSLGVRNHTDALDARALALFGLHRQPESFEPASKPERVLRELCRYRHSLVCQRTALKNQAKETTESRFVAKALQGLLRRLDKAVARVEDEMRTRVESLPAVRDDVALLETIYGVGFLPAVVIRAELGDLSRFERARQLTAHTGLNPCVRQSGTSVRGKTHLSKQGNGRVRFALFHAARTAIRGDNNFARDYQRLIARGLAPMAALGAIMRKLLVVMRALIIHRQPYDPHYRRGGKPGAKPAINHLIQQTAQALSP